MDVEIKSQRLPVNFEVIPSVSSGSDLLLAFILMLIPLNHWLPMCGPRLAAAASPGGL